MQKISLDLDGVIFDSENLYRVYLEMYDVNVLKKDSIVNNSYARAQKRYNWSRMDFENFMNLYNKEVVLNSNLMPGVDIVLKELSKYYEFIIVTARSDEEIKWSKKTLEKIGLGNIKIINKDLTKVETLIREKCDYIIDDNEDICEAAFNNGIKSIYFKNSASTISFNNGIKTVNNWGEIYKYLILGGD